MISDKEISDILQKHHACRSLREINAIKECLLVQELQSAIDHQIEIDIIMDKVRNAYSPGKENIIRSIKLMQEHEKNKTGWFEDIVPDKPKEIERINNLKSVRKPPYNYYESPWDWGKYHI